MKIRIDYVSNSSSSSFIINFSDKGACIDAGFMKLMAKTNNIYVRGVCKTKKQFDEIKKRAGELFGEKAAQYCDPEELSIDMSIDPDNISPGDDSQVKFLQDAINLKNSNISCGCGDDWGEDLVSAVQIATILESRYKAIEIEGDDHFEYESIRGTDLDN